MEQRKGLFDRYLSDSAGQIQKLPGLFSDSVLKTGNKVQLWQKERTGKYMSARVENKIVD